MDDAIEIVPLASPPVATVRVPGSKSITNRALVLAALGSPAGPSELTGALRSDDTELMVAALGQLGYAVSADWPTETIRVAAGDAPRSADLFLGNSGTSLRFLAALVALGTGTYRLDGVARMRERPVGGLIDALNALGATVVAERDNACPPLIVRANGLPGGPAAVRCDESSQFLSALLMAAPHAANGMALTIDGPLVSEPYISMTVAMLRAWGYRVDESPGRFTILHQAPLQRPHYAVEGDASAASYWYAAAAFTGGTVTVPNVPADGLQGDVRFLDVLAAMGCRVDGATVTGGPLRGVDVDMNAISDTVMTLAAVACFADGPTTIRNVAHIRHKETDRIAAVATEVRKLGPAVEEFADGLRIVPGPLRPARIATYHDHRMAMAFAVVGLRQPGVVIENPGCVRKTYPRFFDDLATLR